MYIDKNLEFSDAQAVTSTAISTDVYDLFSVAAGGGSVGINGGNAFVDLGQAAPDLHLVVITNTACTDTGSDATLTITLESADNAGLSSGQVVHFSTGALAFAAFSPAGTRLATLRLPHGQYKRYLGLRYTVASGPLTAGAFDAFLTLDPAGVYRAYNTNFTVV